MTNNNLLQVIELKKYFFKRKKAFKALDNISFSIEKGQTLGLVGESGCGKTTLAKTILRLLDKTAGEVLFDNKNIFSYSKDKLKNFRKNAQIIFQDPYSSLNPRMTVEEIISEPFKIHKTCPSSQHKTKVIELLKLVGLDQSIINRFPHEFSGGQRQRIGIARALSLNPKFIICDEPVSALDVSIQAQIINLLKDLQEKLNLTYLFISHDLAIVKYISNKVAVMYQGQIVESSKTEKLFSSPFHPYTKLLISSAPSFDPTNKKRENNLSIKNKINNPNGCPFSSRCINCFDKCLQIKPTLKKIDTNHFASCHLLDYL